MNILRRQEVLEDLINLSYYLALDDLEIADRFLNACDETFQQLARMPYLGKPRQFNNTALQGIRMWFVKGFEKHLIFYYPLEDGIEIIRVLHAARDLDTLFSESEK